MIDFDQNSDKAERAMSAFGSEADICACPATSDVRFTPNSDRESGHRQAVMSALPPKADMCSALAHVCFGPIADMIKRQLHQMKSPGTAPGLVFSTFHFAAYLNQGGPPQNFQFNRATTSFTWVFTPDALVSKFPPP